MNGAIDRDTRRCSRRRSGEPLLRIAKPRRLSPGAPRAATELAAHSPGERNLAAPCPPAMEEQIAFHGPRFKRNAECAGGLRACPPCAEARTGVDARQHR